MKSDHDLTIAIDPHPLLDARVFVSEFPAAIGEISTAREILELLSVDATAAVIAPASAKDVVRDLLRQGGYKPTGRGKPASEYLIRAVTEGKLGTINLPVDACNAVSLHSGLPISVVDWDKIVSPFRIGIAPSESEYVFNLTGQSIQLDGLLCLFDSVGPCANGVKDSQRTKTSGTTKKTLSVIWGTNAIADHVASTEAWYHRLLESAGAVVTPVNRASEERS